MWEQATIVPVKDSVPSSPVAAVDRLDGLRHKVDAFLDESTAPAWQHWRQAAASWADAAESVKERVADWAARAAQCVGGHADDAQRAALLQRLAWYSAGGVDPNNPQGADSIQVGHFIVANNAFLNDLGLCQTLTNVLKRYAAKEEKEGEQEIPEEPISDCLTITYLLLICSEHWTNADTYFDIDLLSTLIYLLTKHSFSSDITRKLFLTLHAGLLAIFGDLDDAAQAQAHLEKINNLPGRDNVRPCSVKDLREYQRKLQNKYTRLDTAPPPDLPPGIQLSNDDAHSMGLVHATATTPLPFETRFPPKSPKVTDTHNLAGASDKTSTYYYKKELELKQSTTASPYDTPHAILEARDIMARHLKVSLGDVQLAHEKDRARVAWERQQQQWKDEEKEGEEEEKEEEERHQEGHNLEHVKNVHRLYTAIVQDIPKFVHVCLRHLFCLTFSSPPIEYQTSFILSITSTLVLLLHWFKVSHILKYEYLAAALMDAGGLLLLTRILVMHDITDLLLPKSREDTGYLGILGVHPVPGVQSSASSFSFSSTSSSAGGWDVPSAASWHIEEQKQHDVYDSQAEAWLLHVLQIMHMLTLDKVRRVKLLVLYKSSASLKRVVKACPDSDLELYALKLLKSQVGYLGYKWRLRNMRTISAISRRCSTHLVEDWLTQIEDDMGQKDFEQEASLRALIRLYHGRHYVSSMLPSLDVDVSAYGKTLIQEGSTYDDDDAENDDEIDLHTKEKGVQRQLDTWISTPVPHSAPPVSPNALAKEINKLYHQPIRSEPEEEDEPDDVGNGWDTPTPTTTTSGRIAGSKLRYYMEDDEEDDDEESDSDADDNANDPLQNINWETLTLEEMSERLSKVEESTPQRWLNVAIDDPQYCKVLTDVEGLDDDETDVVDDAAWL